MGPGRPPRGFWIVLSETGSHRRVKKVAAWADLRNPGALWRTDWRKAEAGRLRREKAAAAGQGTRGQRCLRGVEGGRGAQGRRPLT